MSDEIPAWVKAALDIDGVADDEDSAWGDVEPRCSSCDQFDLCRHDDILIRENGSHVCRSCDRLLHGSPMKEDSFCGQCGRKWVRC